MTRAFVGLGSNQGDRRARLERSVRELERLPETRVLGLSSLYDSEAVGDPEEPRYLNAVVMIETGLGPRELLDGLRGVEEREGRPAVNRSGPRTLDLDLLFYGDTVLRETGLEVPHPRTPERLFVLLPMTELDPAWKDPRTGLRMDALLNQKRDHRAVRWAGRFRN